MLVEALLICKFDVVPLMGVLIFLKGFGKLNISLDVFPLLIYLACYLSNIIIFPYCNPNQKHAQKGNRGDSYMYNYNYILEMCLFIF